MKISTTRLHLLTWALIYGGLFIVSIGVALQRNGEAYGWPVVAGGAVVAAAGVVLVWLRSRMAEPPPQP